MLCCQRRKRSLILCERGSLLCARPCIQNMAPAWITSHKTIGPDNTLDQKNNEIFALDTLS